MTTLTRTPRAIGEQQTVFRCVSPDHWRKASARDQLLIRDHRCHQPVTEIRQHDYCTSESDTTRPLRVQGRLAFCPLGDVAEDHEWKLERMGHFVISREDLRP